MVVLVEEMESCIDITSVRAMWLEQGENISPAAVRKMWKVCRYWVDRTPGVQSVAL